MKSAFAPAVLASLMSIALTNASPVPTGANIGHHHTFDASVPIPHVQDIGNKVAARRELEERAFPPPASPVSTPETTITKSPADRGSAGRARKQKNSPDTTPLQGASRNAGGRGAERNDKNGQRAPPSSPAGTTFVMESFTPGVNNAYGAPPASGQGVPGAAKHSSNRGANAKKGKRALPAFPPPPTPAPGSSFMMESFTYPPASGAYGVAGNGQGPSSAPSAAKHSSNRGSGTGTPGNGQGVAKNSGPKRVPSDRSSGVKPKKAKRRELDGRAFPDFPPPPTPAPGSTFTMESFTYPPASKSYGTAGSGQGSSAGAAKHSSNRGSGNTAPRNGQASTKAPGAKKAPSERGSGTKVKKVKRTELDERAFPDFPPPPSPAPGSSFMMESFTYPPASNTYGAAGAGQGSSSGSTKHSSNRGTGSGTPGNGQRVAKAPGSKKIPSDRGSSTKPKKAKRAELDERAFPAFPPPPSPAPGSSFMMESFTYPPASNAYGAAAGSGQGSSGASAKHSSNRGANNRAPGNGQGAAKATGLKVPSGRGTSGRAQKGKRDLDERGFPPAPVPAPGTTFMESLSNTEPVNSGDTTPGVPQSPSVSKSSAKHRGSRQASGSNGHTKKGKREEFEERTLADLD